MPKSGMVSTLITATVVAMTAVFVSGGPAVGAANVPDGFVASRLASVDNPTAMAVAPAGRVFVAQKGGDLRIVKNGALLGQPFAEFSVNTRGERGLLGVALHPDFAANGYVYVYRTAKRPKVHNEVVRVRADGDRMVPAARRSSSGSMIWIPSGTTAARSTSGPTADCTWRWATTAAREALRSSATSSGRCSA